jgi:hypothetical protein
MTTETVSKAARVVGLAFGVALSLSWVLALAYPMGY